MGIFAHSSNRLTRCQTVRLSGILKALFNGEKGYIHNLHVHTASDGMGYTLHINTAHMVERGILHVHTAGVGGGERDIHCMSKLQVVESETPCMSIDGC
jgi:hypothetical protein